jgi:hypothetical protein
MITSWLPTSFAAHFCTQFTKLKNICTTALDIWSQSRPEWHVSALASCVCVCVHVGGGNPYIHNLSNIPCRKKTRTMRSGDSTVRGIPNTWYCCLLFMNTLNNPLIHCHWDGFEMAWHYLFSDMQALAPTLASQATSAFWNVSVGSVSHCIRLIFLWHCRVHLPFTGFIWM